jgi:fatty acid desaturase
MVATKPLASLGWLKFLIIAATLGFLILSYNLLFILFNYILNSVLLVSLTLFCVITFHHTCFDIMHNSIFYQVANLQNQIEELTKSSQEKQQSDHATTAG